MELSETTDQIPPLCFNLVALLEFVDLSIGFAGQSGRRHITFSLDICSKIQLFAMWLSMDLRTCLDRCG